MFKIHIYTVCSLLSLCVFNITEASPRISKRTLESIYDMEKVEVESTQSYKKLETNFQHSDSLISLSSSTSSSSSTEQEKDCEVWSTLEPPYNNQYKTDFTEYIGLSGDKVESEIFQAIYHQDLDALRTVVEDNKVDLRALDNMFCPPLTYAIIFKNLDIIKYIISKGVNINIANPGGYTALHFAAISGRLDIIEYLIANGAWLYARATNMSTALGSAKIILADYEKQRDNLQIAACYSKLNTYKLQLDMLTSSIIKQKLIIEFLHKKMISGERFFSAIKNNYKPLIEHMIRSKQVAFNIRSPQNNSPLITSVMYRHEDLVSFFINKGANVFETRPKDGWTLLHIAAGNNQLSLIKKLLKYNLDINARSKDGMTALHIATQKGAWNIVAYLVYNYADRNLKNNQGKIALNLAETANKREVISEKKNRLKIADFLRNINDKQISNVNELFEAIVDGNIDIVKYLIQNKKVDINIQYYDDNTPLYTAVINNKLEIVKYLITNKEGISIPHYQTNKALVLANHYKFNDIIEYLQNYVDTTSLLEHRDKLYTSITNAIKEGRLDILEWFVNIGVHVNDFKEYGYSMLFKAVYHQKNKIANWLLDHGADVNSCRDKNHASCLYMAIIKQCDKSLIHRMISMGADVNSYTSLGLTPLHAAANLGNLDTVTYLLDHGAKPQLEDYRHYTASQLARLGNFTNIADFIDQHPVTKLYNKHVSALFTAVNKCDLFNVKNIVAEYPEIVNTNLENGKSILTCAIEIGYLPVVSCLVAHGAKLFTPVHWGYTATELAKLYQNQEIFEYLKDYMTQMRNFCTKEKLDSILLSEIKSNNIKKVEYLVDQGVDINGRYGNDMTPLLLAVSERRFVLARWLVTNGANVNYKRRHDGLSPLGLAVRKGRLGIIKFLLEYGANINIQDSKGMTPLHTASQMGYLRIVQLLLAQSANMAIKNIDGLTACELAQKCGNYEIVEVFEYFMNQSKNGLFQKIYMPSLPQKKSK